MALTKSDIEEIKQMIAEGVKEALSIKQEQALSSPSSRNLLDRDVELQKRRHSIIHNIVECDEDDFRKNHPNWKDLRDAFEGDLLAVPELNCLNGDHAAQGVLDNFDFSKLPPGNTYEEYLKTAILIMSNLVKSKEKTQTISTGGFVAHKIPYLDEYWDHIETDYDLIFYYERSEAIVD